MFLNKIKLFLLISICLIFFFLTYNDVKSEEIKIISGIAKVTDGDTIRIKEKKIRLLGIDAPEKKQKCQKPWLTISIISFSKDYPCGQISTDKLKNKVNNKFLICKWTDKDRYKRYIAECFKEKKIRLLGIDAPEKKQKCQKPWLTISIISFSKDYPCGQISTDKLKKKVNNKLLICKWTDKDRYKRYIAECFKDKININAWMVRNGYAVAYRKYSKKFVSQEILAKKEKLGLWSGSFKMPWDWRKS